jgi:hypothetical protein
MGGEEIEAALRVTNGSRCKPPVPDGDIRYIARWTSKQSAGADWMLDSAGYVADLVRTGVALTPTQRHVLLTLCHRANPNGLVIGGRWIETETGYGRAAVHRAIKALKGHGLMIVDGKSGRANRYRLDLPSLDSSDARPRASSPRSEPPPRGDSSSCIRGIHDGRPSAADLDSAGARSRIRHDDQAGDHERSGAMTTVRQSRRREPRSDNEAA